jgi:hypothetical protein
MPANHGAIYPNERRTSVRRSGFERRTSGRADPSPRRAQLRRQTDVVEYLGTPGRTRSGHASDPGAPPPLRLPKRPVQRWIDRGLRGEVRGLFS